VSATHLSPPDREPEAVGVEETLRQENDQLRTALATRIVIEQAKGMLAERLELCVDDAFERLRREARNRRMSLHVLAAAVTAREGWASAIFAGSEPHEETPQRGGGRAQLHQATAAPRLTMVRSDPDR
jgi:hypothetical protein